jgi:hypothetical protein
VTILATFAATSLRTAPTHGVPLPPRHRHYPVRKAGLPPKYLVGFYILCDIPPLFKKARQFQTSVIFAISLLLFSVRSFFALRQTRHSLKPTLLPYHPHSLITHYTKSLLLPTCSASARTPTALLSIPSTVPLIARVGAAIAGGLRTGGESAGGHVFARGCLCGRGVVSGDDLGGWGREGPQTGRAKGEEAPLGIAGMPSAVVSCYRKRGSLRKGKDSPGWIGCGKSLPCSLRRYGKA